MSRLSKINKCRSCESKNLSIVLSLGNLYLSEFRKDNRKPTKFPLTIILCNTCKLLQLKETTPNSVLYTNNYGYKSGINNTMREELKMISNKALEIIGKRKNLVVVDIGANDGTMLSYYPKSINRIAVEPIKKFVREIGVNADTVVNDFFNYKSFQKKTNGAKVDVVTAISCFYDMPNPNKFLLDITKILKDDGVFIIQQNYLKSMLEKRAFDNIVHEHLEYYSLLSLENLLSTHNLEVFKVELSDINGGSFRTYIDFKGIRKIEKSVLDLRKSEKKLGLDKKTTYLKFAKDVKKTGEKIKKFIETETKKGKNVYVYGASTRGNTLLQYFNLNNKIIKKAVERNEEKWGTKISSLGIPIISEEQARKEKPDYLLVLPWFFKEEFLQREKEYLEKGGHFIFPLPTFEVI